MNILIAHKQTTNFERMEANMPASAQHPGGMAATFSPNVNMMQFLDWLHAHFSTGGAYFGTSGASIAL